ncbi:MAG: ATP-binding cassette domain-containing protein, partial [Desulfobacteraceae bacterium]|nr:ATP-binding cassette domain-containing protein [Desulfobacteraceae bacterium]
MNNERTRVDSEAPMLSLENVFKSFLHHGDVIEVLKGVSLVINPGDSLAVMGASGVGKSTLLNIMGSLDPPSKGLVKFREFNMYQ